MKPATTTETQVRRLQAAIRGEKNKLRRFRLKCQLEALVKELGAKHERQQRQRFATNGF